MRSFLHSLVADPWGSISTTESYCSHVRLSIVFFVYCEMDDEVGLWR